MSPVNCLTGGLLAIACLLGLAACGYHPPAPVEEQSNAKVERQLNPDGSYFVASGDTLYAIAFGQGLDVRDVARWNEISRPYTIYTGQKLRLSAPPERSRSTGQSGVKIATVKSPAQTRTKTINEAPAKTQPVSKPVTSSAAHKKTTAPTKPSPGSSADPGSWKWPTDGPLLRTYAADDPARNGLDIVGKEGQPIIATAAGQVVYSGNGLIGYGELIIIKHSEKMLSAYAHNKVRLVKEGDQVSSGQKIAEMGRNTENKQLLHWEIRSRGKPVNPLNYLPKK
jgi:lipoprotein NlpD